MKLLIDQDLICSYEDISEEEIANIAVDLKKICVHYSFMNGVFKILTQKVTLDEVAMNEFMFDILNQYFSVDIEYAALGGAGCDIAFNITNKQ